MELKLKLEYADVLKLIKQLPAHQLVKLNTELDVHISKDNNIEKRNSIHKLLLQGPIMDDNQYNEFLENRNRFNKWRVN